MHPKKIANLLSMPGDQRYGYFVRKVADFEEVWGLFSDGWAAAADDDGRRAMPFWPEEPLAAACAVGPWSGHLPKRIPLDAFLARWMPGMHKDGLRVAVFPTPDAKGVFVAPSKLKDSLTAEIQELE